MGGEIRVRSEPGKGSCFTLRIYLSPDLSDPREEEAQGEIRGYLGPRRSVLVADDDPDHRTLIRTLLEPLGFDVLQVADGLACLDLVEAAAPDLILLDLFMPGMGGQDVARVLRERSLASGRRLPRLILVSANASELLSGAETRVMADATLAKPFAVDQLLDLLRRQLDLTYTHER